MTPATRRFTCGGGSVVVSARAVAADHRQHLASRAGVVAEGAEHPAGYHGHARLVDAARCHALVRRLDHHRDAARLQHVLNGVGDLRRQLLLDLQALGIGVHHPGELADADDAGARKVGDVGTADDRAEMVLAMAFDADVAQQHDLVVAVGLLEGAFQNGDRVFLVAGEELGERAHHAAGRVEQALALGVVAGPAQQHAHGDFRLLLGGTSCWRGLGDGLQLGHRTDTPWQTSPRKIGPRPEGATAAPVNPPAGSMDPAALVRAVQAERRDRHVEILARGWHDHVIGADHEARGRVERRAGSVFKTLPRFEQRLLADHAGTVDVLRAAVAVGDVPGAAQQLHRLAPAILDPHAIGPDVVALLGLGLVLEVEGPDGDADMARGFRIVLSHETPAFPLRISDGFKAREKELSSAAHSAARATGETAASPRARSSVRSSTSSSPTERRMAPSVMPCRARSSGPIRICVVVAGCVASDFESPRLFDSAMRRKPFIARNAPSLPPRTSNVTIVPPPLICRTASACCGWSLRVGYHTRLTSGRSARKSATASALRVAASTRSLSVSSPFSSSQALNAESVGPVLRTKGCSVSSIHFRRPSTAPPSTRPWQSMCLLQEYTTTSAPKSSGFCPSGVANTLSTTTIAPAACASSHTARRSTSSSIGLDGVSSS